MKAKCYALTDEQIATIKAEHVKCGHGDRSENSISQLAARYGVARQTISRALRGVYDKQQNPVMRRNGHA